MWMDTPACLDCSWSYQTSMDLVPHFQGGDTNFAVEEPGSFFPNRVITSGSHVSTVHTFTSLSALLIPHDPNQIMREQQTCTLPVLLRTVRKKKNKKVWEIVAEKLRWLDSYIRCCLNPGTERRRWWKTWWNQSKVWSLANGVTWNGNFLVLTNVCWH